MKRLTERDEYDYIHDRKGDAFTYGGIKFCGDCYVGEVIDKLAEYEDLEEQGLLLKLPCRVETPYWEIEKQYWIDENECRGCSYYKDLCTETFCDYEDDTPRCMKVVERKFTSISTIVSAISSIGKTVFLTKEKAEEKLKELQSK